MYILVFDRRVEYDILIVLKCLMLYIFYEVYIVFVFVFFRLVLVGCISGLMIRFRDFLRNVVLLWR